MEQKNKKLTVAIVILAILLCINVIALAGTLLYNRFVRISERATVDVHGNIITPEVEDGSDNGTNSSKSKSENSVNGKTISKPDTSVSLDRSEAIVACHSVPKITALNMASAGSSKSNAISLHNRNSEDNASFQVTNMFPGDRQTKSYCVKVSYKGDIIVRYHADILPGYEKIAEVLKVKIRLPDTDETLYDGLMRDMPESLNHALHTGKKTQSEIYYEITTYLDTSVGNDYQDKELLADFCWWVEETDNLYSPQEVSCSNILLWPLIVLILFLLFILIILLVKRRKEKDIEDL